MPERKEDEGRHELTSHGVAEQIFEASRQCVMPKNGAPLVVLSPWPDGGGGSGGGGVGGVGGGGGGGGGGCCFCCCSHPCHITSHPNNASGTLEKT